MKMHRTLLLGPPQKRFLSKNPTNVNKQTRTHTIRNESVDSTSNKIDLEPFLDQLGGPPALPRKPYYMNKKPTAGTQSRLKRGLPSSSCLPLLPGTQTRGHTGAHTQGIQVHTRQGAQVHTCREDRFTRAGHTGAHGREHRCTHAGNTGAHAAGSAAGTRPRAHPPQPVTYAVIPVSPSRL